MERRTFLKGVAGSAIIGAATGLYTWQVEPHWLEFVHLDMSLPNLPNALVGKTLIQLSDLHIGALVDDDYLIGSLQLAQQYDPDIVVYTGDFASIVSGFDYSQIVKVLKHKTTGKLATVGVLGNHDYGPKWSHMPTGNKVAALLEQNGISILRNAQKTIAGLVISGIDDVWSPNFAPTKVLNQINPTQANLVLCHNPDVADHDVWGQYNSWILSGHTHGGQVKPPFLPPPILPVVNKNYTSGRFDLSGGRTLYINRALGYIKKVRLNVRPEITVFTLRQA